MCSQNYKWYSSCDLLECNTRKDINSIGACQKYCSIHRNHCIECSGQLEQERLNALTPDQFNKEWKDQRMIKFVFIMVGCIIIGGSIYWIMT